MHPTVSLEAPRAELTGLELIDESTRQMPSNSISTNNESLTEVNRATPASLSRQVQDGVGPVSTDSVGPLEYSAYFGAPTGGSSIDERGGQDAAARLSNLQVKPGDPDTLSSQARDEFAPVSTATGTPPGYSAYVASPTDGEPSLKSSEQDAGEPLSMPRPRFEPGSPASSSLQAQGETEPVSTASGTPPGYITHLGVPTDGISNGESSGQDDEEHSTMPRRLPLPLASPLQAEPITLEEREFEPAFGKDFSNLISKKLRKFGPLARVPRHHQRTIRTLCREPQLQWGHPGVIMTEMNEMSRPVDLKAGSQS